MPPVRPPELIFEKDDKNIKQMLQSPPPQLNIPKIMSDKDMREYLRNEFKRLSKNLENVDYDKLDDQSKFNYILCKQLSSTRPQHEGATHENDEVH